MKERYLSKTPNVTFVYLSKCNIKLPGIFGNSKKRFLWTGLLYSQNLTRDWTQNVGFPQVQQAHQVHQGHQAHQGRWERRRAQVQEEKKAGMPGRNSGMREWLFQNSIYEGQFCFRTSSRFHWMIEKGRSFKKNK